MVLTRATIKQNRAEAARQKKREEAFEAAINRREDEDDYDEIQDENSEEFRENSEELRRKKHVGTQTILSGPVDQAMDRKFTVSIKILFVLIVFIGLISIAIYYFYCLFQ